MQLVRAAGPLLDEILDETYPFWGDGLTRQGYGRWNVAQERTNWGTAHLQRLALVENGRLLASAKRYNLTLHLRGRQVQALGVGAVFTPEALRGRGHAAAIISALEDQAREDGAEVSVLFSEIGPKYYERASYVQVPIATVEIDVPPDKGAPAMLVRAGEARDAADVAAMYGQRADRFQLALLPDEAYVRYAVAKKRIFSGLTQSGRRTVEYFVAEEGHRAVAFVLLQIAHGGRSNRETWSLEACGDRDPAGARLGAMLQALRARAPAALPPVMRAWWPTSLRPPQLQITPRPPAGEVMMIKPLVKGVAVDGLTSADVIYWHGDAF